MTTGSGEVKEANGGRVSAISSDGAEQRISGITKVLFVGETAGGFLGEANLGAEAGGEVGEEGEPGLGSEGVAAGEGAGEQGCFGGIGPLAQAGFHGGVGAERVEFAGFETGGRGGGVAGADDDGAGREVAETLGLGAEEGGQSAGEVAEGKGVDGAEEVADDDLFWAQVEAALIGDAQAEEFFAYGATAPEQFERDAIEHLAGELEQDEGPAGEIRAGRPGKGRGRLAGRKARPRRRGNPR